MSEDTEETSIVVRAYNEAKYLPALFEALKRQSYRKFSVLLVDSGSIDGSREIAVRYGYRVIRIRSQDFSFGYSLNVGIRAAAGRFIAIVSAHTIPCDEFWLERLIGPLSEEKVAMVYGRQCGVAASKFSECEDFRRTFGDVRLVRRHDDYFANNANSAIRKELWHSRAFDETLPGLEDIQWARYWTERGYEIVYEPHAALHHVHEESWHQVRHRYYREAVAARTLGILGPGHALTGPLRECAWALADMGRALRPRDNPAASRLTTSQRFREIAFFRFNKAVGTLRGAVERPDMSNAKRRRELFFDGSNCAVVVTGPHQAALKELPIPQLTPSEVLVHVHSVAVCATDLEIFEGKLGYYREGTAKYPITPGHEFSGEIAAVGTNVTHLREGDPVVAECIQSCGVCGECRRGNAIGCAERTELGVLGRNGAYARYVVVPSRFVHKLPAGLDLASAALVEPAAVILKGLRRLREADGAGNGSSCAIIGAGPLGHMCALILKHYGYQVRVFDRAPERLAFLSRAGIETSIDLDELNGFDLVVELTGNVEALAQLLRQTPAGARVLLLGFPYGERPFNFETITAYDKSIIGSVGSTKADFETAISLLPKLSLDAFHQVRMPLGRFREAWERSRKPTTLKVMLDPRAELAAKVVAVGTTS